MTPTISTINIMVAESCEVTRLGLLALFSPHNNLRIIAETDSYAATLTSITHYCPNIVLIDPLLNDGDCLEQIPDLLLACPTTKILLFTGHNDSKTYLHALRLGVAGIVFKQQSATLLLKAIRTVYQGQLWFDRSLTQMFLQSQSTQQQAANNENPIVLSNNLSNREREIAQLACKGLSAKKIGAQLFISEKTVRNNLTTIYEKLEVSGQIELCLLANQFDFSS